jgi:hypothetical protein
MNLKDSLFEEKKSEIKFTFKKKLMIYNFRKPTVYE